MKKSLEVKLITPIKKLLGLTYLVDKKDNCGNFFDALTQGLSYEVGGLGIIPKHVVMQLTLNVNENIKQDRRFYLFDTFSVKTYYNKKKNIIKIKLTNKQSLSLVIHVNGNTYTTDLMYA